MRYRSFLLIPAILVVLVEVLVTFEQQTKTLAWPVWFSFALIAVNFFAYCLVGWLAARQRQEKQLATAVFAGTLILVFEIIVRSVAAEVTESLSDTDHLLIMIKETLEWTSPLSNAALARIGIVFQYLMFSPFYILLSLLGGLLATRYSSSN